MSRKVKPEITITGTVEVAFVNGSDGLEAVHLRHEDVAQDDIKNTFGHRFNSRSPAIGRDDGVPMRLQQCAQGGPDQLLIVNDEDMRHVGPARKGDDSVQLKDEWGAGKTISSFT